jgi:NADPH:quinone reductase-like Zn-dependent oxidoreductase
MKVIRYHDYGGPEVMKYEEAPKPAPADDQILVRAHAMSVNPVDWKIREGHVRQRFNLPMPATPGGDLSGVVEQVGKNGAGFKVGDEVFALIGLWGAYAEYVCIKPAMAALKPKSMDHVHAASVPLAALTAWQGLTEKAQLKAGQKVLVQAAAGGVGQFAVQLAKTLGATVVGTCSPANNEFVKNLGASATIDYHTDFYAANKAQFDVVLDCIGGEVAILSLGLLKPNGILVGVAPPNDKTTAAAAAAGVRAIGVMVRPDGAQLAEIGRLIDAGKVKSEIAKVFALADAGKAHDLIKTGHTRGKIVLKV